MRSVPILLAAIAMTLGGCKHTPETAQRLASDAEIDAAQAAQVEGFAKNGRWNEPFAPFTVAGNVHYVGTETVSAFLVTTADGHILIDGVLAQSVPQIIANIRALGFDIGDVKYLLNTHAHIDHAGGLAGLQRASGAQMLASAADKPFLEAGAIDHGPSKDLRFPPVRVDRIVRDGDTLSLGGTTLTAHMTPGHSPGCTSWSMAVKAADGSTRQAFLHCSATVAGQSLVPEAYPGMVAAYRSSFAKVKGMRADIFLGNHDSFFGLHDKRKQLAGSTDAFVDVGELQRFNSAMEAAFEADLAKQRAAAAAR